VRTPTSLRRRLAAQLAIPLLVLFAIDGAISYWAVRHYADEVYDRWLYDSVNSLAHQIRLTGERAALNLPPIAQEMFEWDDEGRVLFRVVGSKSGHIAGDAQLPLSGDNEVDFRNALLFDAQGHGSPMRFGSLTLDLPPPGEKVTVVVGETTRKRDRLADEILFYVWFPQFFLLMLA
jgi:two-component system, OmpR family, sensor histidine kinase TctE